MIKFYQHKNPPTRFSKFKKSSSEERSTLAKQIQQSSKLANIICYCLMPNHFHFLLRQNTDHGISKFMANFQNSYARFFNTKYQRYGPLWQGPFKVVHIENDTQLLHLSRYIHLNPYSSAIVRTTNELLNYPWSSLSEYTTKTASSICQKQVILSEFNTKSSYQKFLLDRASYQKTLKEIEHLTMDPTISPDVRS